MKIFGRYASPIVRCPKCIEARKSRAWEASKSKKGMMGFLW